MSKVTMPILIKRNAVGEIVKIIVPDLALNLSELVKQPDLAQGRLVSIRSLQETLLQTIQDFINMHGIANLAVKDKYEWHVKQCDENESYQWLEIRVDVAQTLGHKISGYVPYLITIGFLGTLGLAEYLGYFLNVVNAVPKKVALASVATDVFNELIAFDISNAAQNSNALLKSLCRTKMPAKTYDLREDFAVEPSMSRYSYGIALANIGIQIFSMTVNLDAAYHNLMMQYDAAYNTGETHMSHDDFMSLAQTSFYIDAAWDFIIPLSMALLVAPKINARLGCLASYWRKPNEGQEAKLETSSQVGLKIEEVKAQPTLSYNSPALNNPSARGIFGSGRNSTREPLIRANVTKGENRKTRQCCLVM